MRFVLTIGLFALLSSNSFAAPWDIVPLKDELAASQPSLRPVQMQRGGSSNQLRTIKGLELNIAVTGLGDISAMALGADGTLYTADRKSGRIWTLPDRRQDGDIDLRRPLPFTFNAPSGLAVMDETIYVADRNAVWVIAPGNEPAQLANLKQANSTGGPHILFSRQDREDLTLGLTTKNQGFRILELKRETGEANLIGEGRFGKLHSVALSKGSDIWAGSGEALVPVGPNPLNSKAPLEFKVGQSITAIALPGQYEAPQNWPVQLKGHILAAQVGPNAMQLIAIPTEFGHPSGAPRVLVEGFLTGSGRSAWGEPGQMVMDKRGLFFADPHNGTLWRLSAAPMPKAKITIIDTADLPPNPNESPKLTPQDNAITISSSIKGTQIDTKSTITQPSSIIYGSQLIKDYDEKKALEEAEKNEATPKKKRRMSRKRKQVD
ncbi:MAG: hypothetical protein ABJN69_04015 [Hellea sp.]